MISESAISKECMSKTLARARNVAKNGGFVYSRSVDYEPDVTIIRACVESSSWNDYPYDVHVELDEVTGTIMDYECTCPAHYRYPGMCKHSAALVLLYNNEPETFRGYAPVRATTTSRSISALMRRLAARNSAPAAVQGDQPAGSVYLQLIFEASRLDRWNASFKICSAQASYVLKDIQEFLDRVEANSYYEYGKKLGFTHAQDMFTEQGWAVVEWLRATTSASTGWWHQYEWQSGGTKRYIFLSPAQVIALLDLYQGQQVLFEGEDILGKVRMMRVVRHDPKLSVAIKPLEDGAYEIERGELLGFVASGNRLYAYDDRSFYCCGKEMASCGEFLQEVYAKGEERLCVSADDLPLFCSTLLPLLEGGIEVEVPKELDDMKPVEGKVEFYLDATDGGAECVCKALYGDASYLLLKAGSEKGKPVRDEALESAVSTVVKRYLPIVDDAFTAHTADDDGLARLLFYGVDELQRFGEVFTTDAFAKRKNTRRSMLATGVSVESNLINLTVSAEDMDADEVAALIASYQGKKHYHKLKDGTFINLDAGNKDELADLERLQLIAAELGIDAEDLARGMVSVDSYNAFILDALAQDEEKDASFKAFVEGFGDMRHTDRELPALLADVMRPYQREGFAWLNTLADTGLGGILADEMGLGKSLQTISLLLCRASELAEHPALIVCPASLVYNWLAEFKKFAPQLRAEALAGNKPARDAVREAGGYDVLVTSYDTLRVDIEDMVEERFSYQVIDEAQFIKNHSTKAAKAVKIVQADHRIALTGTPIENRLSELWSIFDYLMPGMLGSYRSFRERYELPIVNGDEEVAQRLRAKVGPFILRRLKAEVLSDLPDKLETVIHAKLEGEQLKLYEAHETRLRQSLLQSDEQEIKGGKIAVLAELMKLRQICCDPRLLYADFKQDAAKMAAICELVESAVDNDQKVLVFSQFTSFLALIEEALDKRGLAHYKITGSTPKQERLELVERFNGDEVPVFLISLKAGGTGLNLVGASVVIHADPWWNAAAQNQATDRAHRIGQTQDVSVFKVIADGTIEERILALQEAKSDLADAVLAADGASLGTLSRDELIALLTSE